MYIVTVVVVLVVYDLESSGPKNTCKRTNKFGQTRTNYLMFRSNGGFWKIWILHRGWIFKSIRISNGEIFRKSTLRPTDSSNGICIETVRGAQSIYFRDTCWVAQANSDQNHQTTGLLGWEKFPSWGHGLFCARWRPALWQFCGIFTVEQARTYQILFS